MAVTKRTRFEVLRRDNHTCQYCGAKAPDVTMHIDHVMPVALGGDDKPGNLVTACKDCNAGKTSITPDSPLVEGLSDRAAAYALGMQDKMTRFRATFEAYEEFEEWFLEMWDDRVGRLSWTTDLPVDYQRSLFRWSQMGVPRTAFEIAISAALGKYGIRGNNGHFNYMAGVIQRMIDEQGIDLSVRDATAATYTEAEAEEMSIESYQRGIDRGFSDGMQLERLKNIGADFVRHHIDQTWMELEDHPFDPDLVRYTGKVVRVGAHQDDKT